MAHGIPFRLVNGWPEPWPIPSNERPEDPEISAAAAILAARQRETIRTSPHSAVIDQMMRELVGTDRPSGPGPGGVVPVQVAVRNDTDELMAVVVPPRETSLFEITSRVARGPFRDATVCLDNPFWVDDPENRAVKAVEDAREVALKAWRKVAQQDAIIQALQARIRVLRHELRNLNEIRTYENESTDLLYVALIGLATAPKDGSRRLAKAALQAYCTRREAPRPNGEQYKHR
jgi:hypothetical protein